MCFNNLDDTSASCDVFIMYKVMLYDTDQNSNEKLAHSYHYMYLVLRKMKDSGSNYQE